MEGGAGCRFAYQLHEQGDLLTTGDKNMVLGFHDKDKGRRKSSL